MNHNCSYVSSMIWCKNRINLNVIFFCILMQSKIKIWGCQILILPFNDFAHLSCAPKQCMLYHLFGFSMCHAFLFYHELWKLVFPFICVGLFECMNVDRILEQINHKIWLYSFYYQMLHFMQITQNVAYIQA